MILKRLRLQNFRNYSSKEFELSDGITLIIGQNTVGKTNLLEAVYLLATGKSFKASLESDMIQYDQEITRVKGRIVDSNRTDLEIVLTRGEIGGQKTARKKFLVNGVSRKMADFMGNLRAVYFRPEDLDLVTNSPSIRRKYLDNVLIQIDKEYARSLLSYEKGLRQRNKLLERIRDEGLSKSQLIFWNQLLIKNGNYITDRREEFIEFVCRFSQVIFDYQLFYDRSVISPARLEEYTNEEVAAGVTLVGPHRDDFRFEICDTQNVTSKEKISHVTSHMSPSRDLNAFGSRGEQRMGVLWLKLSELEFITQKAKERPILLLDDIFSELDEEHRNLVLDIIPSQQTIITTTDLNSIDKKHQKKAEVVKLT